MPRPNVYLDERQRQALQDVAAAVHVPVEEVLRQAVADYLERCQDDPAAWVRRFDHLVDDLSTSVPTGVADEEIEADVTAAITEVRQARRAARRP
jgi:hypothetical protein